MTISVAMYPHAGEGQPDPTNGISAVVKYYFKYLPNYGIELLPPGADNSDLVAVHAGSLGNLPATIPVVSHCHGLYFTSDNPNMGVWTDEMNGYVVNVLRHATGISVPSTWVGEMFKRDMHLEPQVIPHGVEWDDWQDGVEDLNYVLWGKNRASDACSPAAVNRLAERAPQVRFLTTYADPNPRPNIKITGTVPFEEMRKMIKKSSVYLSSVQETFGVQILEAMAAGKPVLGFRYGGNVDLVVHGHTGYLAEVGNYDDLTQGLDFCMDHRRVLGENAREAARHYTWDNACEKVANLYRKTVSAYRDEFSRPMRIDPALYQGNRR